MATTKAKDDDKSKSAAPAPEPNPPATPQFVPVDDFKRFEDTISQRFQQFQDSFNATLANLVARGPSAPQHVEEEIIEDVPTTELEQALADGKGADRFVKALDARSKKLERAFTKRFSELEGVGVNAIADLAKEMSLSGMPYYKEYKKEVDSYIDSMPPASKLNKGVYQIAYNAVVGAHIEEIKKKERETILREAADPNDANLPTDINGRGKDGGKANVPTVEELLGKDAAAALESVGRTPDQHARRFGHKDWATYAVWVKEQEAANV